jgi:hypothetical protein
MKCEKCGNEHDGTYGSGRFCSKSCASKRNMTEEYKKKISVGVNKDNIVKGKVKGSKRYFYICDKCGKEFESKIYRRNDRKKHCNNCIRKSPHSIKSNNITLLDLSKRTVSKILKRAKVCCSICGWDESSCDIHHIIEKSIGGTNDVSNLIIVCPNCHRICHVEKKFDNEFLMDRSVEKIFNNWKDFYHTCN